MRYRDTLDYERGVRIVVEFMTDRRDVVDYAVVLTIDDKGSEATARAAITAVRTGYEEMIRAWRAAIPCAERRTRRGRRG